MTTLDTARIIMRQIAAYNGPMDLDSIVQSIGGDRAVTIEVIEFLQETRRPSTMEIIVPATATPPTTSLVIEEGPLDLLAELTYNYQVAKALLKQTLQSSTLVDGDEVRKSLRTISTFMDSALKLQERLFNAQQVQRFQEAVLAELDLVDRTLRDRVLNRLLETDL